jgi:hypothetical protein
LTWTFIYLMVGLKIPIIALGWIVWRAVQAGPALPQEEIPADDGGGSGHPRPRHPRPPRRGPHGDPLPVPPARVRAVGTEPSCVPVGAEGAENGHLL